MGHPRSLPPAPPPTQGRKGSTLPGGPGGRGPRTHLQGVSRDDQGTVMLPAESVQLEVGLAAVGHLEGNGGVEGAVLSGDGRTTNSGFLKPGCRQWPPQPGTPALPLPPDPEPNQTGFVMILREAGEPLCQLLPCISPSTAVIHIVKEKELNVTPLSLCARHYARPFPWIFFPRVHLPTALQGA